MATYTIINDTDGTLRVHRKGCADITRRQRLRGANGIWDREAANVNAAVEAEREELRDSGFGDDADDFQFVVLPCAEGQ